jgi:hypothetical protein
MSLIQMKALSRLATALTLSAVLSANAEPLHDHDNGPLTGFFGIPDSTEGAYLVPGGKSRWGLLLTSSSHSILDGRLGESVLLDGETTRLELTYRRGIGDRWEIGFELPYLWHESGGLDQFVDAWHDLLGLPGGFRERREQDQLDFLYADTAGQALDFSRNSNGIGDARFVAGYRPFAESKPGFAIRLGLKLPTGDSAELLGSGGTDLSLGIAGDTSELFGLTGLSGFYRLNTILVGKPDLLGDRYRDVIGHASLGFGYLLGSSFELRLQGAVRTAAYHSEVEVLGDPSGTVTLGGIFRLTNRLRLSIAVGEDVKVRSAPDVTIQMSLRYLPE